jgi:repressor LexA
MALTRRQHEVLEVIRAFIGKNGYSPSLEEIGTELRLSSVATVHKHVSHLVQKGYVRRAWNQNRSIEVVDGTERVGVVTLRLAGTIAAGRPVDAVETAETIAVPASMIQDVAQAFVLRVQGESMIDEQIRDGDLVVCERRAQPKNGETVVALVDGGEATLKRLERDGSRVRLEPANARLKPIIIAEERVEIQGVVVGVIRRY